VIGFSRAQSQATRCSAFFLSQIEILNWTSVAQIVVRVLFGMLSEPLPALLCDSLKEAREFVLSRGATVNLRRDPFDDPAIIEGWI
jgi:hypothetical protein